METPACHSYFATHLDALCISSHRAYHQNYTWFIYGREYENISTSQMGKHKESEGWPPLKNYYKKDNFLQSVTHSRNILVWILASLHRRWESLNRRKLCLPNPISTPPLASCLCKSETRMCGWLHLGFFLFLNQEGVGWGLMRMQLMEKLYFCVHPHPSQKIERRRRSLLSGQQVEHLPEGQAHLLCARGRRHGDTLWRAQWVQRTVNPHHAVFLSTVFCWCGNE